MTDPGKDSGTNPEINPAGGLIQKVPRTSNQPPILSSYGSGWDRLYLEYHHRPTAEAGSLSLEHLHMLCIETTSRSCGARKWMDGRFQSRPIIHGDVFVLPEQVDFREQVDGAIEYILLYLDAAWVAAVAHETIDPDRVEILPHFPQPDQLIYQIGLKLKASLETDTPFNRLYAESLMTTLALHLLQHYSTRNQAVLIRDSDYLPQAALKPVIDYIHAHLEQNLSLAELADQAQMSLHYFARLFKQSVGLSPHQYVIQCRIERAKELLLRRELTVAEIAHQVGFIDQSHLNRHFKNWVGVSPKQWLQR
jgi:AraC family transcriptional regulator